MEKERLDIILVDRGCFKSREKARSAIMAGVVYVNGEREDKPGAKFNTESKIEIKENINPYVSRGGLKLRKALEEFSIDLEGKTVIDVGSSTGGFTDCMLKNGAARVYAIDVGYGQLAWELRNDPRVVCMERTNIRYVKQEQIGYRADFASIDVSFISLKKVLPAVKDLLKGDGQIVCLIKPQFEAGKDKVGKHGVVREASVHCEVTQDIADFALNNGFKVINVSYSPIKGPEGNIEYLLHLSRDAEVHSIPGLNQEVFRAVERAHENLI